MVYISMRLFFFTDFFIIFVFQKLHNKMQIKPRKIYLTGIQEYLKDINNFISDSDVEILKSEIELKIELVSDVNNHLELVCKIESIELKTVVKVEEFDSLNETDLEWLLENSFSRSTGGYWSRDLNISLSNPKIEWNKKEDFFKPNTSEQIDLDWEFDIQINENEVIISK